MSLFQLGDNTLPTLTELCYGFIILVNLQALSVGLLVSRLGVRSDVLPIYSGNNRMNRASLKLSNSQLSSWCACGYLLSL
jgi:hypothetical protein